MSAISIIFSPFPFLFISNVPSFSLSPVLAHLLNCAPFRCCPILYDQPLTSIDLALLSSRSPAAVRSTSASSSSSSRDPAADRGELDRRLRAFTRPLSAPTASSSTKGRLVGVVVLAGGAATAKSGIFDVVLIPVGSGSVISSREDVSANNCKIGREKGRRDEKLWSDLIMFLRIFNITLPQDATGDCMGGSFEASIVSMASAKCDHESRSRDVVACSFVPLSFLRRSLLFTVRFARFCDSVSRIGKADAAHFSRGTPG